MNIRKFQDSDRSSLIDLWSIVFPDDPPHNEPSIVIAAKLAVDDLIFIAEHDSTLVGACMAGYDGHRGSVFYLAVTPELQKTGYGQDLMSEIERLLILMDCPKLNIVVRSSNAKVLHFYSNLEYTIDDVVSLGKRLIPDD